MGLLYFLGGISGSTFGRFSGVYYVTKNLNPEQIGDLEAAMPIIKLFAGLT